MTKRSFFLTVAAGLLASVAFATPSQAAPETVTTTVSFSALSGGNVSDFTITYTPAVDPIGLPITLTSSTNITSPTFTEGAPTPGANTVHLTFNPVASGAFVFTFTTGSNSPVTFSNFSFSGTSANTSNTVAVSSTIIPEPTSMALLGIGMSGFLAFRRFFKRSSVAFTN